MDSSNIQVAQAPNRHHQTGGFPGKRVELRMIHAANWGVIPAMQQNKLSLIGMVSCLGFVISISACGNTDDPDSMMKSEAVDRTMYPAGPYGKAESNIIANLAFKNPDDTDFDLNEIFADENNKLLLVSTSSGWCTSCIEEQAKLQARHVTWNSKGLYILLTTFEDQNFAAATPAYAGDWKEKYGLGYKVVADAPFLFQEYYDRSATPMVMLVDIDTMTILKIMTGFDADVVDSIIASALDS